jgi:diketogulonate reductase-like aldo/keto reductase
MKTVLLPDGEKVPALGQGTWRMGENRRARKEEVAALRLGVELGMTLIDTAEMYGEGAAEEVVADAIADRRERVFVVTKVYPHNASRGVLPKACENSRKRLRIETIDLYLLHWRGEIPLGETVEAFEKLREQKKIRRWGVSNFDVDDMKELKNAHCSADQVLYNLQQRSIESELLPWSREHGIPIMAYAPVGHGRGLLENPVLKQAAKNRGATPAQIALAWLLRQPGIIAIPKAADKDHVRENAAAADFVLKESELAELDRVFPPPKTKQPLPML